jgi:hypothetical protein
MDIKSTFTSVQDVLLVRPNQRGDIFHSFRQYIQQLYIAEMDERDILRGELHHLKLVMQLRNRRNAP